MDLQVLATWSKTTEVELRGLADAGLLACLALEVPR